MRTLTNFRGTSTLQDQISRLFNDAFERTGQESNLTAWAPAVDIYETEHELVVKADFPDIDPKDLDIRVENNILTYSWGTQVREAGKRGQLPAC